VTYLLGLLFPRREEEGRGDHREAGFRLTVPRGCPQKQEMKLRQPGALFPLREEGWEIGHSLPISSGSSSRDGKRRGAVTTGRPGQSVWCHRAVPGSRGRGIASPEPSSRSGKRVGR
jgi:hypothetical protein